jgi:hypothetical protein
VGSNEWPAFLAFLQFRFSYVNMYISRFSLATFGRADGHKLLVAHVLHIAGGAGAHTNAAGEYMADTTGLFRAEPHNKVLTVL